MLTVADVGEGGVKNPPKSADVINGRPQTRMKFVPVVPGSCALA